MFIAFEGIDGSGKTTQIKLFNDYLKKKLIKTFLTAEPGGTTISKSIDLIVKNYDIPAEARLLLFLADRVIHIQKIEEMMRNGKMVITDRYSYSTVAYQGYGEGLNVNMIWKMLDIFCPLTPDIVIFLDVSPESVINRYDHKDMFERKGNEFYHKVANGYREMAKANKRIYTIDASGSIKDVHKSIVRLWENEIRRA